jgi:hypothetical protein
MCTFSQCHSLHSEDGGSKVLQNVGVLLQHCGTTTYLLNISESRVLTSFEISTTQLCSVIQFKLIALSFITQFMQQSFCDTTSKQVFTKLPLIKGLSDLTNGISQNSLQWHILKNENFFVIFYWAFSV